MTRRITDRWAALRDSRRAAARVVVDDARARQGPKGKPVLAVLLGSFCLLAIYLSAMMIWAVVDAPVSPRDQVGAGQPANEAAPPVVPSSALNGNDPPAANPAYPVPAVPYVE